MPRNTMSATEQIANWERKAVEAQIQLLEQKIIVSMWNRPSIVRPLWEKCMALGITEDNMKEVEPGFEKSRAAQARDKQKSDAKAKRAAVKEAAESDNIPAERGFTLGTFPAGRSAPPKVASSHDATAPATRSVTFM
eukprot:4184038-Amphidinium_carterae.1